MTTFASAFTNLRAHENRPLDRPVRIAVIGTGDHVAHWPEQAEIVAVAEMRDGPRARFAERHGIAGENVYQDWRDLAARGRIADAAVLTDGLGAAAVLAEQGYDLLLANPVARTGDLAAAGEAAARTGVAVAVGHVPRYTPYTHALRKLLPGIGDIVGIEHREPLGAQEFAHTIVRGGGGSAALLTKTWELIDWLSHLVGRPVVRTSWSGGPPRFRPENRPDNAAERCLDCPLRDTCVYSATTAYRDRRSLAREITGGELTERAITWALATGPHGRCVYAGEPAVPDHQVIDLAYTGGITASLTMSVSVHRETTIFGTRGRITGDGRFLRHHDFGTDGGEEHVIRSFVDSLRRGRPELIRTDAAASHRVALATERARLTGTTIHLSEER